MTVGFDEQTKTVLQTHVMWSLNKVNYVAHWCITSESHSLKLTTAEFLSTSNRSIGTSLCQRTKTHVSKCCKLQTHNAEITTQEDLGL